MLSSLKEIWLLVCVLGTPHQGITGGGKEGLITSWRLVFPSPGKMDNSIVSSTGTH